MVTSSYSRTIQMYIASHFHDTYVIDLRYEENSSKSLQQFIDEYGITDVLIFGQPTVTYYSAEGRHQTLTGTALGVQFALDAGDQLAHVGKGTDLLLGEFDAELHLHRDDQVDV